LRVYADWFYADKLYAQFRLNEEKFRSPGGDVIQLPAYSLLDGGASYRFDLPKDMRLTASINVNNILNNVYISEMFTNAEDNPDTEENEFYTQNQGFYGFGTTWNAGIRLNF